MLTFDDLAKMEFDLLHRVYSSFHATVIGFISRWWNSLNTQHEVMDQPPQANACQCDLILLSNTSPAGVVEVQDIFPDDASLTLQSRAQAYFGQHPTLEFVLWALYHTQGHEIPLTRFAADMQPLLGQGKYGCVIGLDRIREQHPLASIRTEVHNGLATLTLAKVRAFIVNNQGYSGRTIWQREVLV